MVVNFLNLDSQEARAISKEGGDGENVENGNTWLSVVEKLSGKTTKHEWKDFQASDDIG